MPMIIWGFLILSGLGHGHTVVTEALKAVPHTYSESAREYRVWTAPRWESFADEEGGCDVRYFALVTGVKPVRLNAEGKEQILDTSWVFDYRVQEGIKFTASFWFIDPIGGETLRYVERSFKCQQTRAGIKHHWNRVEKWHKIK